MPIEPASPTEVARQIASTDTENSITDLVRKIAANPINADDPYGGSASLDNVKQLKIMKPDPTVGKKNINAIRAVQSGNFSDVPAAPDVASSRLLDLV